MKYLMLQCAEFTHPDALRCPTSLRLRRKEVKIKKSFTLFRAKRKREGGRAQQ